MERVLLHVRGPWPSAGELPLEWRSAGAGGGMKLFSYVAACVLLVAFGIYIEIGLWNECRTDHSWFYCMRVLGSR